MIAERAGRACEVLLLVFAFALPLSIAVSEIALVAALVAWLLSDPRRRPQAPGFRPVATATLVLVGTWLLASAFAADPLASLTKARKIYSIVLVLVLLDHVRDRRAADRLAVAALAGGTLSAGFGLLDFAAGRLAGTIPGLRLEGVFSTAMTTGNVFATLAIAAVGECFLRAGIAARLALAGLALLGAALVGTLTRSSWLAFLSGSSLIVAARRPRILLFALPVLALAIAFGPSELRERAASIVDPTHETNAGRISLWRSGVDVVRDHPWTGVGLADHYALIESYRRPDATFHAGHFHNNVVQVAASTGLVGLAAYAAWMLVVAWLLVSSLRRAGARAAPRALTALAVWCAFQVHGVFDWSFGDAEVANQFFLWVGLGLASGASGASGGPDTGDRSHS